MGIPITYAARLMAVALLCGGAAAAHDSAPQTIPGLEQFSLPSQRPTPRATPAPAPTTSPRDFPPPKPTPKPTPEPTPEPTPAPLAPPPLVRTVPAPRPTPIPTADRPAMPIPRVTPPTPTPTPTPSEAPEPLPRPLPSAAPLPLPSPAARPWSAWDRVDPAALLAVAVGLAMLAMFGLGWWWRNRPVRERAEPRRDSRHEIFALGSERQVDPPSPPAVSAAGRAILEIDLMPKRAGTNLLSAAVEYQLVVRNAGTLAARAVRLDLRLLGAGAEQDAILAAVFADPIERPVTPPFDVPPATTLTLDGVVMQPRATLVPLAVPGLALFVPVVAVNARYEWAAGAAGQVTRSFVIGIDRGGAKLRPFRLDGARMYDAVAALPYA